MMMNMEKQVKRLSYHSQTAHRTAERMKLVLKELPSLCSDYFRSISQTTSALTRLAYAYDLRLFFVYLSVEEPDFADVQIPLLQADHLCMITQQHIEGFQEYLQYYIPHENAPTRTNEPVQNSALGIMRKLSSIRSFFDYLFRNQLIPANIATLVLMPKRKEKPIMYMTTEEVQRMMDAVAMGQGFGEKQQAYLRNTRERDTAILMLFLGTGIRVSELVGLDLDHIDLQNGSFMVTRKGGSQTILYLPETVCSLLETYLAHRRSIEAIPGHEHALFLSLQKRRISTRAVENLVKKYALVAAPLKKKLSPHKLRSTFGTNLYKRTGDIYLVAETLGHADVNTTRRHYAAMSEESRKQAAKLIELPDISNTQNNT